MYVGRYYLKKKQWLAANRCGSRWWRANYQTTAHVEEALMRLVEAYMALGIVQEAQTAAAVLGHNFPNSQWYKDSYVLLQSGGLAPREESRLVAQQGLEGHQVAEPVVHRAVGLARRCYLELNARLVHP